MTADRPQASAAAFIVENTSRWLHTRLGMDPVTSRFAAKHIIEIMWPYVLTDAYGHMADGLRNVNARLADEIDTLRHDYLSELLLKPEEGSRDGTDRSRAGGDASGAPGPG